MASEAPGEDNRRGQRAHHRYHTPDDPKGVGGLRQCVVLSMGIPMGMGLSTLNSHLVLCYPFPHSLLVPLFAAILELTVPSPGAAQSVSYANKDPLLIMRGEGAFLYDEKGTRGGWILETKQI